MCWVCYGMFYERYIRVYYKTKCFNVTFQFSFRAWTISKTRTNTKNQNKEPKPRTKTKNHNQEPKPRTKPKTQNKEPKPRTKNQNENQELKL